MFNGIYLEKKMIPFNNGIMFLTASSVITSYHTNAIMLHNPNVEPDTFSSITRVPGDTAPV